MVYLDTQKGSLNIQRGKTPSNVKRILLQFFQETISPLRKTNILQANVYSLRQQSFSQILLPKCFMMAFFLYLKKWIALYFSKIKQERILLIKIVPLEHFLLHPTIIKCIYMEEGGTGKDM